MKQSVKIFISIIVSFFCILTLTHEAIAIVKVITTTEDLAFITKYIGKDFVEVESLAKGYENLHFVTIRPSFIVKLRNANMLVISGMGLDEWINPLIEKSSNKKIFNNSPGYVDASNGIKPLEVPSEKIDRSMGDIHPEGNPHYWLDPVNSKFMALNITKGLKKVDPDNANEYEKNYMQYLKTLSSKLNIWLKEAKSFQGKKIITYHSSWPYFAKRFNIIIANTIEPKPGIPPSAKHVNLLIKQIKQENISLIMTEPYFSNSVPQMISKKTGIKALIIPSSTKGIKDANDYFALFDTIIEILK